MAPDLVRERRVILQPMGLVAEQQVAATRHWREEGGEGRQRAEWERKGQGGKAEG